jgi:hypothetical protein
MSGKKATFWFNRKPHITAYYSKVYVFIVTFSYNVTIRLNDGGKIDSYYKMTAETPSHG